MIQSIHVTLSRESEEAAPIPTFVLFCSDPEADREAFSKFVVADRGMAKNEHVRIMLTLPDPALRLGWVDLPRVDAIEYQARNRACGGVNLMLVKDEPGTPQRHVIELKSFYIDWLGVLGQSEVPPDADRVAPVTGLGWHRARRLRKRNQFHEAAICLLDDLVLASHGPLSRNLSYVLHEAGLIAEAMGNDEAWEYFETVSLMVYPNCHDALIGLALLSMNSLEQVLPLLGRAYAIRPRQDELQLFVQTFGRADGRDPAQIRESILAFSADTRLDVPLYRDATGKPLAVDVEDMIRHLRVLTQS